MSEWRSASAPSKLNLALVVGPLREDGLHEVTSVMERLTLHDTVSVRRSGETSVSGFDGDTLVTTALDAVRRARDARPRSGFEARIEKRIPVAAGLGGGSSDAATALRLASELLEEPLDEPTLHRLAATLGADVPFFLAGGAQLATGDGTTLEPLALPRDYTVLLVLPDGVEKSSTRDVYASFDARRGEVGYDARRGAVLETLAGLRTAADLALLPPSDLASSPLADELRAAGAFRADVTGAGPVVYGLFASGDDAVRAATAFGARARTWIANPG